MPLDFPNSPTIGDIFNGAGVSWCWDGVKWTSILSASADGPFLSANIANVLNYGADPTGIADSTLAFRNALASGKNVFVPRGTYLITGSITVGAGSIAQALYGEGQSSVLLVDTRFDPTVTTGVVVLANSGAYTDRRPSISSLMIKFIQPTDLITTAIATSAVGASTVTISNTAGVSVGMIVVNSTQHFSIESPSFGSGGIVTVTAIAGNVVTLSKPIVYNPVTSGDSIHFASSRSLFKTLANGATTGPGGTGVRYPWAIYNDHGETTLIQDIMIVSAWNGIWFRGSSFHIDQIYCYAFNIGLDMDQCYNFPSLTNYNFWPWGQYAPGVSWDAQINVYYDGQTIAANLGETDGVGVHNFQTWCAKLNLVSSFTWGLFTNVMMDGDNSDFNITSTIANGYIQIANFYTSKGRWTDSHPVYINAAATFLTIIKNYNGSAVNPDFNGIRLDNGILMIDGGTMWDGIQSPAPMIQVNAGQVHLTALRLDASPSRMDAYIVVNGTASITMDNCTFVQTPGTDAVGLLANTDAKVLFNNVNWNGWRTYVNPNNSNNGAILISPRDYTTMQAGCLSLADIGATSHYNAAFGSFALALATDTTVNSTAFGSLAGYGMRGKNNTIVGSVAAYAVSGGTGDNNTIIGAIAGYTLTSGANNTLIGLNAGNGLTTGSGNIYIADGTNMGFGGATENNTLRIGTSGGNLIRATGIDTASPKLFLDWFATSPSYTNDAAAAAGGVGVAQLYRNGSAVMVRVA